MIKLVHLLVSLVLLAGCTSKKGGALDYSTVNLQFQSPDCEPENDACLMVSIKFPLFDQGDSLALVLANRIIRNSIIDNIGMGDVESITEPNIDEAVQDLNKSFEDLQNEFGSATGWQADISSRELYRTDSVLVIEVAAMTYFGGAHPNSNIRYFNFDRKLGRFLPISFFVDDMKAFTTKAEAAFKKASDINEGASYDDSGFNFLGNRFVLSANYAFLGDSIRLHYNQYEIAPYAAGDFEVTVSLLD
jgi:uncharacterized protein DUF3298